MRFIGVLNRDGGTFRTLDLEAFVTRANASFEQAGHSFESRVVSGDELIDALRQAADDADVLLAGGGDGTISAAAAIAYRKGVPLAVLPAGTMNLFARSLGLPLDLDAAVEALAGGEIAGVDIATANGRPFVHQFSVGFHAKLVKLRETLSYNSRWGKMLASCRAFFGVITRPPNFSIEILTEHGLTRRRTSGVAVSNNPFGEGHVPHADALDAGVLGIYVAKPLSAGAALKLVLGVMTGRWSSLPELVQDEARLAVLRFPHRKSSALAVIDGELVALQPRIELAIHPGALKVLLPKAAAEAAEAADEPARAT